YGFVMDAAEASDPKIGMMLQDRYRVVRKLGEGGMGAVYEGEHVLIKRRVAIKCLHAQFAQNAEVVARFRREAQAATSIGHENIIEVTDMGLFDDGTVFMVLEYLEGRDWSDVIEAQGAMSLGRVVRILSQVCDALGAAHAKGIVHRDLKPENIYLIERSGNPDFVKVLDFGISKFMDPEGPNHSMTRTGTTLGTPYFMSPEQARGSKEVDGRTDLYALGVILFHSLTGRYPFDDESFPALILKICHEAAPSVRTLRPDLPEAVDAIVSRLLSKEPRERFQDCASLKAALSPFADVDTIPLPFDDTQLGESAPRDPGREVAPDRTPADQSVVVPRPGRLRQVLVALVVVGAGVAIAMGAGAFSETASSVSSDLEEPAATTESRDPEPPSEPSDQVAVSIATVDETGAQVEADLFLDGQPIRNPFQGRLPRRLFRVEARLTGYTSVIQDMNLEYDAGGELVLRMQVGEGTEDRRASMRRASSATAAAQALESSRGSNGEAMETATMTTTMEAVTEPTADLVPEAAETMEAEAADTREPSPTEIAEPAVNADRIIRLSGMI
ncbi:MAG: serine/threonine-protein kinase, partial [Myxococcota bacterium]